MSFLVIERGANPGLRVPLKAFPVTAGRDPSNTMFLPDEEVSRFHFRIKQRGRLYILEDLESRNGTFVNGDKVINTTLQSGDKILIGNTELLFLASEPNIQIAPEIIKFDMMIAEDLGITGPIEIEPIQKQKKFRPVRLNPLQLGNRVAGNPKLVTEIYNHHGNLMVINELTEASNTLLKSLGQLMPTTSRAAFFIWSDSQRQLLPFAARTYKKIDSFLLSQRAFEDVITRKQGVLLLEKSNVTKSGKNRAILPMAHNEVLLGLVHLEIDDLKEKFSELELELGQALINRSSSIFEAMMLRKELDSWMVGMIETMIATVEAKDTYTRGHSERVSRYCMAMADELKLNREIKQLLMISALCHDVGKIGIPDAILKKASLLSAEEYEEMKLHPTIGANIVNHMPGANRFLSGVKYHHEKWDGTGYPEGLEGENIPFFGRSVAIADVFDAMVSGRSYSGFMEQSDAAQRLWEERELFDPEILKAFIRAHDSGRLSLKTSTQNNETAEKIDEIGRVSKTPKTGS